MKRFKTQSMSLFVLVVLFSVPVLAQDFPSSSDDPALYIAKVSGSAEPCEETLTAFACRKANELKARALKNLQSANEWFGNADQAAEIGNDIGTVIEAGADIIEMGCTGQVSMDPIKGPLQMIIAKAAEGYSEGKGYQYLAAADSCLSASKAWASLCRACCKRAERPAANNVVDTNPDVDFNGTIKTADLKRLLESLDQDERRATFEAAKDGSLACSPEVREAIGQMIKPTVLERVGGDHYPDSFFDVYYGIDDKVKVKVRL